MFAIFSIGMFPINVQKQEKNAHIHYPALFPAADDCCFLQRVSFMYFHKSDRYLTLSSIQTM